MADKIKVLIVDDIAETRENVRKLLQFESDVNVVGAAQTGKEGVQLALDLDPDVVLMDINMPDIDGITATEMIRAKAPHIQVVILSVQSDQNYMRRAMLAGARDFLTKPPMGDELSSAIRRAADMAFSERAKSAQQRSPVAAMPAAGSPISSASFAAPASRGKVITVYSPKGGSGCTTVAVNLALALNNEDTRVVLVDASLQFGDVAIFMNEQGKNTILDIAPRVNELEPDLVDDILIKHQASGLRILAAPQSPEQAEQISADQYGKVLQYLQRMFSYVIVDTPRSLNDIVITTFDYSDLIVLLATQEIPAIKNTRTCLDLLQGLNVGKERILFAMNKFDKRLPITPERVSENLKHDVSVSIPFDEKVITTVNRGIPFMVDAKSLPAAKGVLSLAEAVRARITQMESQGEAPGKR